MPNSTPHPGGNASQRPQNQKDEQHGSIKGAQLDDRHMREKDLPRGSEPETHARK